MMDGPNCLPFFQESEIEGPARRNQLPDGLCHGLGQGGRLWSWLGRQRDFPFLGTWQRCVFTRFCPEKNCNKKQFMSIIAMNSKGRKITVKIMSWKVFCNILFSSIPRCNLKMSQDFFTHWKKKEFTISCFKVNFWRNKSKTSSFLLLYNILQKLRPSIYVSICNLTANQLSFVETFVRGCKFLLHYI